MIDQKQVLEKAKAWVENPVYDEKTRLEVQLLIETPEQLIDAFFRNLSFGTGGLRGLMGVGTNRINTYTIRHASQVLAYFIQKNGVPKKGVIIGFDSRLQSQELAEETAKVLVANGITVFLSESITPTPLISFACSYLDAQAGVMITASHNPPDYNGYKVYGQMGGQIMAAEEAKLLLEAQNLPISQVNFSKTLHHPLVRPLEEAVIHAYLNVIQHSQLFPNEIHQDLKIVYTSLHGVGIRLMPQALAICGLSPPFYALKQIVPNGYFPTVTFPNPEEPATLKYGIDYLLEHQADILLANDPDADRLAVVVLHEGKPYILSGNEMAMIASYMICFVKQGEETLHSKDTLITTLVTTPILKKIAAFFQIKFIEVLPGFKYISEKIYQLEKGEIPGRFLFGAEDSYGYLFGSQSKDKDGISAGCLFAQIASHLKKKNKTLIDTLYQIYTQFGLYRNKQQSLIFEDGKKGIEKIEWNMEKLRKSIPDQIGGYKVIEIIDYLNSNFLPRSNMLKILLENETTLIVRPSGTEPRLKVYGSQYTFLTQCNDYLIQEADLKLEALLKNFFVHHLER